MQPAGEAVKFWEREYYENDFQLAKSLGMNAFRISLEWARIQPKKDEWNQEAIDHYKKMLRAMGKVGLRNSLRGWENYATVEEFVKFTDRIVTELKDLVDLWITQHPL